MKKMISLLCTYFLALFSLNSVEAASKTADQTVKIGYLVDMSGIFSDLQGPHGLIAVQMAIEDFKTKYKPDFKIELVSADHQNKPDIGSAKAREWLDSGADLINGLTNSGVALAVSDLVDKKGKVAIVTGAGSLRLTDADCKAHTLHYGYDTYALSTVAAKALLKQGAKKWFFITNNYAFGLSLEEEAKKIVQANGGDIVGVVRHPFETTDFTSYLLQAQNSGADVVALANAGAGVINAVKQANEFGMTKNQKFVGLLTQITDVQALGLDSAQGMLFVDGYVWDRTPEAKEWSNRFFEKTGKMPTTLQAADYSSTMHYLRAIQAAGSKDSDAVVNKMKETPVNDFFAKNGRVREDGLFVHDMFLMKVKKPGESKGAWDLLTLIEEVPGDQAYQPLAESKCPLIKKK